MNENCEKTLSTHKETKNQGQKRLHDHRSKDRAKASSERERSALRRMPLCSWPSCWEARVIHWKSSCAASDFNSDAISVFRTKSGVPEIRASRSRRIE